MSPEKCRAHALDASFKHLELIQPAGMKNIAPKTVIEGAKEYLDFIEGNN